MPEAAFLVLPGMLLQQIHHKSRYQVSIDLLHDAGMFWWLPHAATTAQAMRRSALEIEGSHFV